MESLVAALPNIYSTTVRLNLYTWVCCLCFCSCKEALDPPSQHLTVEEALANVWIEKANRMLLERDAQHDQWLTRAYPSFQTWDYRLADVSEGDRGNWYHFDLLSEGAVLIEQAIAQRSHLYTGVCLQQHRLIQLETASGQHVPAEELLFLEQEQFMTQSRFAYTALPDTFFSHDLSSSILKERAADTLVKKWTRLYFTGDFYAHYWPCNGGAKGMGLGRRSFLLYRGAEVEIYPLLEESVVQEREVFYENSDTLSAFYQDDTLLLTIDHLPQLPHGYRVQFHTSKETWTWLMTPWEQLYYFPQIDHPCPDQRLSERSFEAINFEQLIQPTTE